jgi:hypothetical protein
MDNRINDLRRKIKSLRTKMLELEGAIRDQINHDQDCTKSGTRLLLMRQELTALVREWTVLGGGDRLPTIEERLKENHRLVPRSRSATLPPKQKVQKRRLAARG